MVEWANPDMDTPNRLVEQLLEMVVVQIQKCSKGKTLEEPKIKIMTR